MTKGWARPNKSTKTMIWEAFYKSNSMIQTL